MKNKIPQNIKKREVGHFLRKLNQFSSFPLSLVSIESLLKSCLRKSFAIPSFAYWLIWSQYTESWLEIKRELSLFGILKSLK